MERGTEIHDTFHSLQDSRVVGNIVELWRKAAYFDGLSRERKVDTCRSVLGVASMAGSGFAYPGVSRGYVPRVEDGTEHQEDDRETSFNHASEAD